MQRAAAVVTVYLSQPPFRVQRGIARVRKQHLGGHAGAARRLIGALSVDTIAQTEGRDAGVSGRGLVDLGQAVRAASLPFQLDMAY
jgi:hypothetical protein